MKRAKFRYWKPLKSGSRRIAQPAIAPQANFRNSSVSRSGSRRLTIRMSPMPVSKWMAGRIAGSPRNFRHLQTRCTIQNAARYNNTQRA